MEPGNPYRLIDILHRHNVPVVLIGGHAVVYHGYVRSTEDVDVIFVRTEVAEKNLLSALTEINARWIGDEVDPETKLERLHVVDAAYIRSSRLMMLTTDLGYLDVFDYVPGLPSASVQELLDSAEDFDGRKVVSLEWLRRMKVASGRPQDLLDLENLSVEP